MLPQTTMTFQEWPWYWPRIILNMRPRVVVTCFFRLTTCCPTSIYTVVCLIRRGLVSFATNTTESRSELISTCFLSNPYVAMRKECETVIRFQPYAVEETGITSYLITSVKPHYEHRHTSLLSPCLP